MTHVSVIVPVYNGLKTIQKALASLQAQTFAGLEIVIADDQSTDGTYDFLQSMAAQDSRIKLVRTSKNLGHGGASNMALEHAGGEWITILDADDWCEPGRMEAMLKAAIELNADMVIDNLQIFDHALRKIVKQTHYMGTSVTKILPEDIFHRDGPIRRDSIGYCKPFIRNQFLRDHKINYWGKYRDNEDFIFLSDIMLSGARTFVIPEAYYVYVHRISPSARTVSVHSNSSDNSALNVAQACDEIIEKYRTTITPEARRALLSRKQVFLTAAVAHQQIAHIQQKSYGKAVGLFVTHPLLIYYRAVGIWNRIYNRLHCNG